MSDERKGELIKFLDNLWADLDRMIQGLTVRYRAKGYHKKADENIKYLEECKENYQQIRQLIQQQPEDGDMEEYVADKACEASRFYSVVCKTVEDSRNFIRQIIRDTQRIQPEIDDMKKYVEEKAMWLHGKITAFRGVFVFQHCVEIVTQIINDARGGGKKLKVDRAFVEDWRKRLFLLLVKLEEKGLLDGEDKKVIEAWEINIDNFIWEMLTEYGRR